MPQQTFSVDGLHCAGCADTVTAALSGLPSVNAVGVSLGTKGSSVVRIDTDSPLTAEQVQAALDSRGNFTVMR